MTQSRKMRKLELGQQRNHEEGKGMMRDREEDMCDVIGTVKENERENEGKRKSGAKEKKRKEM